MRVCGKNFAGDRFFASVVTAGRPLDTLRFAVSRASWALWGRASSSGIWQSGAFVVSAFVISSVNTGSFVTISFNITQISFHQARAKTPKFSLPDCRRATSETARVTMGRVARAVRDLPAVANRLVAARRAVRECRRLGSVEGKGARERLWALGGRVQRCSIGAVFKPHYFRPRPHLHKAVDRRARFESSTNSSRDSVILCVCILLVFHLIFFKNLKYY